MTHMFSVIIIPNTLSVPQQWPALTKSENGNSHSLPHDLVIHEIWDIFISHSIWISPASVPGKENLNVDEDSRRGNVDAEWIF